MTDRSEEIAKAFQVELDRHHDPASVRVVCTSGMDNEGAYKAYIHRPELDQFVEYDVFLHFDEPFTIPPYGEWKR